MVVLVLLMRHEVLVFFEPLPTDFTTMLTYNSLLLFGQAHVLRFYMRQGKTQPRTLSISAIVLDDCASNQNKFL